MDRTVRGSRVITRANRLDLSLRWPSPAPPAHSRQKTNHDLTTSLHTAGRRAGIHDFAERSHVRVILHRLGAHRARHDPTGNLWVTDDAAGTTTSAPDATVGDIRRVHVHYRPGLLSLKVRFVDLRRTGDSIEIKGEIRTTGTGSWMFAVAGGPGHWKGTADLLDPDFQEVSCRDAFRIDYTRNVISYRIPSRCLHRPGWVRFNFSSMHAFFDTQQIYEDYAVNDTTGPAWSARIRRG